MFLGVEIGGTKIQLGVFDGISSELKILKRTSVVPENKALGIRDQIQQIGTKLLREYDIKAVGIGFGGPFNHATQKTIKSHQIEGWDDFPLQEWAETIFQCPVAIENDADTAGLAEAVLGAGKDASPVFYVTVGTGIGGGLIIDKKIYHGGAFGASEIGHLRPGFHYEQADQTVESMASGWGISDFVRGMLDDAKTHSFEEMQASRSGDDLRQKLLDLEEEQERDAAQILDLCDGKIKKSYYQTDSRVCRDRKFSSAKSNTESN